MTNSQIKNEVNDEFLDLKKLIERKLSGDFLVDDMKDQVRSLVKNEIFERSRNLLDTQLNYLFTSANEKLEKADTKLKILFLDEDIRGKVRSVALDREDFTVYLEYSRDPQKKKGTVAVGIATLLGIIAAGIALKTGSIILFLVIVGGLITVLVSGIVYRKFHDMAAPEARVSIREDVDRHIDQMCQKVHSWMGEIEQEFDKSFKNFCKSNSFSPEV